MSVLGLIGVLVFFAGVHLIWQAREDLFYWLEVYVRLFRTMMQRISDPQHSPVLLVNPRQRKKNTVRLAIGFLLAFFLAPMLTLLDLAL